MIAAVADKRFYLLGKPAAATASFAHDSQHAEKHHPHLGEFQARSLLPETEFDDAPYEDRYGEPSNRSQRQAERSVPGRQ